MRYIHLNRRCSTRWTAKTFTSRVDGLVLHLDASVVQQAVDAPRGRCARDIINRALRRYETEWDTPRVFAIYWHPNRSPHRVRVGWHDKAMRDSIGKGWTLGCPSSHLLNITRRRSVTHPADMVFDILALMPCDDQEQITIDISMPMQACISSLRCVIPSTRSRSAS